MVLVVEMATNWRNTDMNDDNDTGEDYGADAPIVPASSATRSARIAQRAAKQLAHNETMRAINDKIAAAQVPATDNGYAIPPLRPLNKIANS
jgi:hypothetical protein